MVYYRLLILATALLTSLLYAQAQPAVSPLHFADTAVGPTYAFLRSSMDEPYLVQLRTKYQLNQLLAVGIPARVVGLMTADVETRQTGTGHVVAEAYLRT